MLPAGPERRTDSWARWPIADIQSIVCCHWLREDLLSPTATRSIGYLVLTLVVLKFETRGEEAYLSNVDREVEMGHEGAGASAE